MFVAWAQLIRAPNFFTVVSNIVAAQVIATQGNPSVSLLLFILASAFLYHAGMIMNDCVDLVIDTTENPQRPLPSRRIALVTAKQSAVALFILGIVTSYFAGQVQSFCLAILLVAMIVAYNTKVKSGWPGSLMMAGCRYVNWVLGLSIVAIHWQSLLIPLPIFLYIAGLTYLSKQEVNATDPRAVNYAVALILAAFLSLVALSLGNSSAVIYAIVALLGLASIVAMPIVRCYRDFCAANVRQVIKALVLGIIPLDAAMLVAQGFLFEGVLVALLLLPARLMARRISVT